MQIKIFTPPKFRNKPLNIEDLNQKTNKEWYYSSSGKASIYHILKAKKIDKILIPVYICNSVLIPLQKLGIKPIFYDIELKDLNPSLDSIQSISKKYQIQAILVASMYGNPANMSAIENYCKENGIFMIDDGAQSFGAELEGRAIGTFGDAGFFSFSAGKPTAGHLGSFFWSRDSIEIVRTKHCFVHYLKWLDFYCNRYRIYDNTPKIIKKIINFFSRIQLKLIDITHDDICTFEKEILGGILGSTFTFRQKYYSQFIAKFQQNNHFRIIHSIRGKANNHKFILLFKKAEVAQKFINDMQQSAIYASNGYTLLSSDLEYLPNAKKIDRCVVELPIEENQKRMEYLFKKVEEFES